MATNKRPKLNLANVLKRFKLPSTPIGRIVQGLGVVVGIGGAVTTTVGMFELTGEPITDVVIIVCTTLILIFGGKYPVPPSAENQLER